MYHQTVTPRPFATLIRELTECPRLGNTPETHGRSVSVRFFRHDFRYDRTGQNSFSITFDPNGNYPRNKVPPFFPPPHHHHYPPFHLSIVYPCRTRFKLQNRSTDFGSYFRIYRSYVRRPLIQCLVGECNKT